MNHFLNNNTMNTDYNALRLFGIVPVIYKGDPENQNVKLAFYIDRSIMEKYTSEGYEIYYLPEQNMYNDQFSQMNFTDSIAKPYF